MSPLSEVISSLTFLTSVALEDLNALCLDVSGSASRNGERRVNGVEWKPPGGACDNELGPGPRSSDGMGREPEAELVKVTDADVGGAEALVKGDTTAVNGMVVAAAAAAVAALIADAVLAAEAALAAELAVVEFTMVVAVLAAVVTMLGADDALVGTEDELVEVEDVRLAAEVLLGEVVLLLAVEEEPVLWVLTSANPPVLTILW